MSVIDMSDVIEASLIRLSGVMCEAAGDRWRCDRKSMTRGPHCRAHYVQLRKYGELKPLRTWPNRQPKLCTECNDGTLAALRGLCHTHSERMRRHGTAEPRKLKTNSPEYVPVLCACGEVVLPQTGLCRSCYVRARLPRCTAIDCKLPANGESGMCRQHFTDARRITTLCIVDWCDEIGTPGRSELCVRHRGQLRKRGQVESVRYVKCTRCDELIDRKTSRADKLVCDGCAYRGWAYANWVLSVAELAARDGAICAIGGEPVNMRTPWPLPGCPTVDHIVPRSRGGSDDEDNLQLACWAHNRAKSNALEYAS
jgi:5-methylcytosine-specific restriction endonuclease McrA